MLTILVLRILMLTILMLTMLLVMTDVDDICVDAVDDD
jgi:hypothetical protein